MFKQHTTNCIIIFFVIILAWNRILGQTFLGEGNYYFFHRFLENGILFGYDLGARLLFDVLTPIFRDNYFLYQLFALTSFSFIAVLFYFFVNEFTKRKDIAFVATILFGVNYTTSFEMLATGAYQNFSQRIFFLIPLLLSFTFFYKSKDGKSKYYLPSLLLCSLSLLLAQYNIFLLAFLVAYTMASILIKSKRNKRIIQELFWILPFILVGVFIVYLPVFLGGSNFISGTNFFYYTISQYQQVIFHSFRQLVFLTVPEGLLNIFVGISDPLYKQGMQHLFIPIFFIYAVTGIFLYKKDKALRVPIITCLLFLPAVFVLNMFTRSDNVDHLGSGSRYLLVPSIGFAIFWAIFFAYIAKKFNKNTLYVFIIIWVLFQVNTINSKISKEEYNYIAIKKITAYLKNISSTLSRDSIVIVPNVLGEYGAGVSNMYYGKEKTLFLPFYDKIDWLDQYGRPFDPNKDIILTYNSEKQSIVDRTKDYKSIIVHK